MTLILQEDFLKEVINNILSLNKIIVLIQEHPVLEFGHSPSSLNTDNLSPVP